VKQPNGTTLFLCHMPEGFAGVSRRAARRYGTAQLRNLSVELPKARRRYRVLDLSMSGCRLLIHDDDPQAFALGQALQPAVLHVGENQEAPLEFVVPRTHGDRSLGCEFRVSNSGPGRRHLDELLAMLEQRESLGTASQG